MAICRGCGKDIRDDIWVCGHCGELVGRGDGAASGSGTVATSADPGLLTAGATADAPSVSPPSPSSGDHGATNGYGATNNQGTPSPQPLPGSLPTASSGDSTKRTAILVGICGLLAVIAIVAVWFFALRGDGGFSAYVGEWELAMQGRSTGLTLSIGNNGGAPRLTMSVSGTTTSQPAVQSAGPFKMTLVDGTLVTKLEAADGASEEQKAAADAARAALGAVVDDFKMVFSPGATDDTLSLTMEGEVQGSSVFTGDVSAQALILTRTHASTSQVP